MSSNDDSNGFGARLAAGWSGFMGFLWNSEEKTVLGRSGKSWGKLFGTNLVSGQ